jgi:hypothetical protein
MSGLGNRNLAKKPNKAGVTRDKAERPDMSGLTGDFGGKIDFDALHFTNSPNTSPLIVRSS